MKSLLCEMNDHPALRQIIDTIADGVFTLDINGEITFWSKSMEQITGFTAAEALGKTCSLLRISTCLGVLGTGDPTRCGILDGASTGARECFLKHKDGHDIPAIKNATAIKDAHGEVIGVVEAITDLTDLEKAKMTLEEATRRLGERHRLDRIIGKSDCMQAVFMAIKATAASQATILIQGESGTGKELVAGAIHYNSERAREPFIIVNCSALSESLLESELFGHAKGAFTGASTDRIGRLEKANHGTVFLDEIGELSPLVQVKLLRVLQERTIERIGESRQRKLDIRVITATHRDLYTLVREGKFREDLYYRLKVFPIGVPPLRDRKTDIPLLVRHFCDRLNTETEKSIRKISPTAMQRLMDYHWPGNVRELENAIEHAFVLCNTHTILPDHLPLEIRETAYPAPGPAPVLTAVPKGKPAPLTRELLTTRLHESNWNKAEAARRLGISRTAVWKRMKQWGIPLDKP
ncbi:sigma-54 interaction domain-containing protein [Desulfoluna spongiiphila]|uniref:PAS domain S-box-containing protein n=1 Tax=Desulfoluna spongiiphila TaxID=419481 RepID=A0A1G5HJK9_9BACT|nr:sigma 54-interacting transcriptional regulator [Desulfoluna spongiiphila]SCY63963.1 PAS domain S-box-containing protein [Desulfoluna spongiiphila]VVS93491.1 pas fold [Desulfoluna spongiiphila]